MYKKWKSLCVLCVLISFSTAGQGKLAGTAKNLIGVSYDDYKTVPGLEDWNLCEASVITPLDNPEMMTIKVVQKGSTRLVIASLNEDTATERLIIVDVIEVRNVKKGWQIRTAYCREKTVENIEIVALVKSSVTNEFLKPAKLAWRFNRDKRRFEQISTKGIDCISEGGD